MFNQQFLQKPFGVSTFGSSIIRTEPDLASIRFAVSRLEQRPRDAFGRAHEAARSVRLKEVRAQARQQAVQAAREKAEIYCVAAGITLGPVIHIEDVNPDQLQGREGHVIRELQPDDEGPVQAFNPGSITVAGAVMVAFELGRV